MESMNSERFLSAFNNIHDFIKTQAGITGRHIGFVDGMTKMRNKNYILDRNFDELLVFNDLRNVIVHKKNKVDFVIAEPHEETVRKIESILLNLVQPENVYPKFKSNVKIFDIGDPLPSVLKEVKENGFSQFPIYEDGLFKGLLTENGITNWLSRSLADDIFALSETKIEDVIGFEEKEGNYLFLSRYESVFEAKRRFLDHLNNAPVKLDAILITENGKPGETLLGIITAWDIIEI